MKQVIVYFFTMDGFFRILKKAVSELICTRLYSTERKGYCISVKVLLVFQLKSM